LLVNINIIKINMNKLLQEILNKILYNYNLKNDFIHIYFNNINFILNFYLVLYLSIQS
jgi:hypothetical protein